VMSNSKIARYLRDADKIIVLGDEGHITDQGSLSEINQQSEYIKSLAMENGLNKQQDENIQEATSSPLEPSSPTEKPESEVEEEEVISPKSSGDLSLYAYYYKSVGLSYTLIVLGLGCFAKCLVLFTRRVSSIIASFGLILG